MQMNGVLPVSEVSTLFRWCYTDLVRVDPDPKRLAILEAGDRSRDHFQQRRVLEVAQFRLWVRIIDPAFVFDLAVDDPAARKGKGFRRVQIGPLDERKGVLRFEQRKRRRADVDIQRAVEVTVQIEPARLEKRTLPVERAVGIVLRGPGGNPVAAGESAADENPVGGHGEILPYLLH
jgi:hypothetical protein